MNAGTVSLTASGTISEDPTHGSIIATLLNGPTVGGSSAAAVNLVGTGNAVVRSAASSPPAASC